MRRETKVNRITVGPEQFDTLAITPGLEEDERKKLLEATPLESNHVVTEGDVTYVQPDKDVDHPTTTDGVRHEVVHALMGVVRPGQIIRTPANFREKPSS